MNYSAQLQEVRAETKAAVCARWKRSPLPASIQAQLAAAELVKPEAQTPDQKALVEWLNRDLAGVNERLAYCGA